MDIFEMIQAVREGLLEFDVAPISDQLILRKLNMGYTFIYSHIVKSDDTRFGQKLPFSLTAQTTDYTLPEEAWGKRVESLVVPFPPTNSQMALGYHKVRRVDYKEAYKHDVPRIRVWVPEVFSILGNQLFVYPKPITSMDAYLLITPFLVPLGIPSGQIVAIGSSKLTIDSLNDTELADRISAGNNYKCFLSVVDYRTGTVKAVFNYNALNSTTREITLIAPSTAGYRSSYLGTSFSDPTSATVMATITTDDYVVPGYASGVNMFSSEYDQFLINQAVLLIRSSLNENDPETVNMIKENFNQLKGDLAGRPTGVHMQRDFGRGASYTRPGRIQ